MQIHWKQQLCVTFLNICLEFKLLLLLSRFSRVWLCATPETAAHQAPPSLGFSRQEHWSGLPFPSPMHESEKGKWSRSVVSDSLRPYGLHFARLLCPWDSPGKNTGAGCHFLLKGSSQPRDWTCVSCLSCTGRQILYHLSHQGSLHLKLHQYFF